MRGRHLSREGDGKGKGEEGARMIVLCSISGFNDDVNDKLPSYMIFVSFLSSYQSCRKSDCKLFAHRGSGLNI